MTFEQNFYKSNNIDDYKNIKSILLNPTTILDDSILITIAIPTYKRTDLLKETIDSALNQLNINCNYEVIVVDNDAVFNQNTETELLINSYSDKKLIYYKNRENIGMFGNWNRCIELARGKWIAFLHDDDLLNSNYLIEIYKLLARKDNISGILTSFDIINGHNQIIPSRMNKFSSFVTKFAGGRLIKLSAFDVNFWGMNIYGTPTCGSIFLKDKLIELGGFNEKLFPSADWFFLIKFARKNKLFRTSEILGKYRYSENESLNTETLKKFVVDSYNFRKFNSRNNFVSKIMHYLFEDDFQLIKIEEVLKLDKSKKLTINNFENYSSLKNRPVIRFLLIKFLTIYKVFKIILSTIYG